MRRTSLIALPIVAAIAGLAWYLTHPQPPATAPQRPAGAPLVAVTIPETLPANAQIGQRIFDSACATCHGQNAAGRDGFGPPLVHRIYEPGHHGDEAFQRAAAQGVQSHHWPFGNMPPVPGLTRGDVAMVVAYVRALQQANGIR